MQRSLLAGMVLGLAATGCAAGLLLASVSRDRWTAASAPMPSVPTAPLAAVRVAITPAQLRSAVSAGLVDRPIKSLLNVRSPMTYGAFLWNDEGVRPGPVWIRIDLKAQILSVFRSGDEIGTAVILYGTDGVPTPTGKLSILAKFKNHRSATYDNAPMPYSLRLTPDGVAIHGSKVRWGFATHGCVGVPTAFAAKLFDTVSVGDPVLIVS